MRTQRKQNEQAAISSLIAHLTSLGRVVLEDPAVVDKPDALLAIDGKRCAVECTTFSPEHLLELHGLRRQKEVLHQVFLPIEPHMWTLNAINRKAASIAQYRRVCHADEVWLLLHAATGLDGSLFAGVEQDFFEKTAGYGAHLAHSAFDRIVLIAGLDQQPIDIQRPNSEPQAFDISFDRFKILSLPVQCFSFAVVKATEGPNGQGMITTPPLHLPHTRHTLQPLDPDFEVDYSVLTAIDASEDIQARIFPSLEAQLRVTRKQE